MITRYLRLILCFILTGFIACFSCYSQEKAKYKCSYQLDFLKDTISMEYFRQEIYIVQIGDNVTKGFTYQKFYLDSLRSANPTLYRNLFNASVKESIEAMRRTGDVTHASNNSFSYGGFVADLYKDYKKQEIRVVDILSTQSIVYKDELKPQDWEILEDTLTILGYQCQKAKCHYRGRDWEAWFTPEVPLSEGPWKFYGLPGLITKLHDTKKHYSFELIGFQEVNEKMDTKIPKDVQKMDRLEFIKITKSGKAELMNQAALERMGIKSSGTPPSQRQYDPIERSSE